MLELTSMSVLLGSADKEIFLMIVLDDIICEVMSFYILSVINVIDIDVLTYLEVLIVFCEHVDNNIHDRVFLHIKCY